MEMTRITNKGLIKRGKVGARIRDYCSITDEEIVYYVVTMGAEEVYKEKEELTDLELQRIVHYYA